MSTRKITIFLLILLTLVILSIKIIKNQSLTKTSSTPDTSVDVISDNQQITIGKTHYLFDIANHEPEQIKTLLERAEALSDHAKSNNDQSKIAFVIHGPDVDLFDKKNYKTNKEIVDMAARLDAFDVIDFKVCQTAADSRGI